MTVTIRFATPDDAARCNEFHNQYYGTHRSLSQWRWEFCSSLRDGPMVPFVLAEDQDRVVATQAMIPIAMLDREGSYWTAKSEETLVDPSYRRDNLFVRLYQRLLTYAAEHDYVSIWGFTGTHNVAIYEKLAHFESPARTRQLFRPLSSSVVRTLLQQYFGPKQQVRPRIVRWLGQGLLGTLATSASSTILALRSRVALVPGLRIQTLDRAPQCAEELCAAFVNRWGGATILRDTRYLQWRIFDNPHIHAVLRAAYLDDRLVGWIAYSLDDDSIGYIVDLLVGGDGMDLHLAERVTAVLVDDAVRRLRCAGALGVRCWDVNDHSYACLLRRVMRSFGFFLIPRGEGMVAHPPLAQVARASLRKFDNWFISRIHTQGLDG